MLMAAACVCLCRAADISALDKGLVRTPPMGFSTWNWFHCGNSHGQISDTLIRSAANAMVSSGMKDSGYQFVSIDDCWPQGRDSYGGLVPDHTNFPNGMKAVADYVHSKGLKFGIYSSIGSTTCDGRAGMYNHDDQDADSFMVWGVDYAKIDMCTSQFGSTASTLAARYSVIRDAFHNAVAAMKPKVSTAHEMIFSICTGPTGNPWEWGDTVGNLWRTTLDIDYPSNPPAGSCNGTPCWTGILQNADNNASLAKYAGPDKGWNDPDMLEAGNAPITTIQSRSHFSLWCMMASPLIAGNDIRNMSDSTKIILTNGEAIRVDQDSLGLQGVRVTSGNSEVWVKKLSSVTSIKTDTNYAILFFNRNSGAPASVTAAQIASAVGGGITAGQVYVARDLWAHKDLGEWIAGTYTPPSAIPNNDVFMIRLSPKPAVSIRFGCQPTGGRMQFDKNGMLTVNASKSSPVRVTVSDLKGRVVYSRYGAGLQQFAVGAAIGHDGIYLVTVRTDNYSFTQRILWEKGVAIPIIIKGIVKLFQ